MTALNRKLRRDLWRLRGQVIAIAMVVASGVGVLVMSLSMIEALGETAEAYYERYRFGHVFASVKRAPEVLMERIVEIEGVQSADSRIVKYATLDVPGFVEPVIGILVSIPEDRPPLLNKLALREGRFVRPGRPDEAVVSETFAEGHRLKIGSHLDAIVNGKKRTLRIVGIALSPEYVYAIAPGALTPDKKRFGVLWMGREALAAAYDLDGAFNDVSLSLMRGTNPDTVIDRLDDLLAGYGGTGAVDRSDQISNWFLMSEIEQLKNVAFILPTIFIGVAAFLAYMVLARLIAIERSEIGLLKAFGYSNRAIAWHYAKLVIVMTVVGIVLGWGIGAWLGQVTTEIYANLYRFPFLLYRPSPASFVIAGLLSLTATLAGAFSAVRGAVSLPPAEAMRPPPPPLYSRHGIADDAVAGWADQPTRMIFRHIVRWPARSAITALGVAMSVGVLITSMQWLDAIDHMVENHYFQAQHQDVSVGLVEARGSHALYEFARMPGVISAEPLRAVSARLWSGYRSHREAIQGVPATPRLSLIHDTSGETVKVPPDGLVIGSKLAEILDVKTGDIVTVEVLEERRPVRGVPVVRIFETYIGTPAYLRIDALNRLMRERPVFTTAHLLVDEKAQDVLFRELKDIPQVSAITVRRSAIETFYKTIGETLTIYVWFYTAFACALAFGVTYNSARIALSERGRELATLRVLGFSRLEVSYILLGEIALLGLLALPAGCLVGRGLVWLLTATFDTELYRVPLIIETATYGIAACIAVLAVTVSAALVRDRIDRLDLIAVLKTRE